MKYASGRAFRQALEDRLKKVEGSRNVPLIRLRKHVAFERFIARLQMIHPNSWVLKGGLALQLRLGVLSRTTKDIDLFNKERSIDVHRSLLDAALLDMGDWFTFAVRLAEVESQDAFGGERYHVRCLLDGRIFEEFHVDVGVDDILTGEIDTLQFEPYLGFAGISPVEVPCYPIAQQIAEKLHALTREYRTGESTRVKDFIDILLIAGLGDIPGESLIKAILSTFSNRKTHPVPDVAPRIPATLLREYNRLAVGVSLRFHDYSEAENALAVFINPVLVEEDPGIWDADNWGWK